MKIPTMDDGPNSAPSHNGGQLGGPSSSVVGASSSGSSLGQGKGGQQSNNGGSSNAAANNEDNNPNRSQYSIPGILHFIQHEWARFEMERSQWDVERAELQVC